MRRGSRLCQARDAIHRNVYRTLVRIYERQARLCHDKELGASSLAPVYRHQIGRFHRHKLGTGGSETARARMNLWDLVFSMGAVGLTLALIPGIIENFHKQKGWNISSTALTTSLLGMMAIALWGLGAIFSFWAMVAEVVAWSILSGQSYVWRKG